ncbi:MAG: cyanoexosortase A system-associated protein [Cyanobacteria bacterium J06600_6]
MTNARTQWRNYIFAVTSISLNLAFIYTFVVPSAGNRQVAEFEFPSSFESAIATTNNIPSATSTTETIKASQQYQYSQNGQAINLQINYLVGTRGDVATYLKNYTEIAPKNIKTKSTAQIEGVGYHALLKDNRKAYLTSCISPRSLSNITQKQFSQNRYQNDLNWQIVRQWLQGKASIRDRRCLWVLLSTPLTKNNIQANYQTLETAWQDIYQWWLPNFPALVN